MNPYLLIFGILIAWLASLAGVGYWQNDAGHTAERVVWQGKSITELEMDNKAVRDTEEKYRAIEQDHAAVQAGISKNYQEQLKNANQKTADLIAAARSGAFRLRDPNAIARPPRGDNLPETSASTGGHDGRASGELSATATEFLLGLAGEADNIARQLAVCQSVIRADRIAQ